MCAKGMDGEGESSEGGWTKKISTGLASFFLRYILEPS